MNTNFIFEIALVVFFIVYLFDKIISKKNRRILNQRFDILNDLVHSYEKKLSYRLDLIEEDDIKWKVERIKKLNDLTQMVDNHKIMLSIVRKIMEQTALKIDYLNTIAIQLSENIEKQSEEVEINSSESQSQSDDSEEVIENEATTSSVQEEVILTKSKKRPKAESKRKITSIQLEEHFKKVTKLTYRGYVIQYGQEAFMKQKNIVYKSLYYQKFLKPKTKTNLKTPKEATLQKDDALF